MMLYWVSAIIQNEDDKRAWLLSMNDSATSIEDAKEIINKIKTNNIVLSAWIDIFDNNDKYTVFHEAYVNIIEFVK